MSLLANKHRRQSAESSVMTMLATSSRLVRCSNKALNSSIFAYKESALTFFLFVLLNARHQIGQLNEIGRELSELETLQQGQRDKQQKACTSNDNSLHSEQDLHVLEVCGSCQITYLLIWPLC